MATHAKNTDNNMTRKVRGKSMRLRVNGHTIALATNCNVEMTLQAINAQTKADSGAMEVPDYISYTITSENVVGMNDEVTQQTHATMYSLMMQKQPVDIEVILVAGVQYGIPAGDWYAGAAASRGFQCFNGKALIKQLTLSGPVDGLAKMSVQLSGIGEPTLLPEPKLEASIEGETLVLRGPAELSGKTVEIEGKEITDNTIVL